MDEIEFWNEVDELGTLLHEEMSDYWSFAREDKKFALYLAYIITSREAERAESDKILEPV